MAGEKCFLAAFPSFFNARDKYHHIGILRFADSEPEMISWIVSGSFAPHRARNSPDEILSQIILPAGKARLQEKKRSIVCANRKIKKPCNSLKIMLKGLARRHKELLIALGAPYLCLKGYLDPK